MLVLPIFTKNNYTPPETNRVYELQGRSNTAELFPQKTTFMPMCHENAAFPQKTI